MWFSQDYRKGWSYWRFMRSRCLPHQTERRCRGSSGLNFPKSTGWLPRLSSLAGLRSARHSIGKGSGFGRGCTTVKRTRLHQGLRRAEVVESCSTNLSEVVLRRAGYVTSCSKVSASLKVALISWHSVERCSTAHLAIDSEDSLGWC